MSTNKKDTATQLLTQTEVRSKLLHAIGTFTDRLTDTPTNTNQPFSVATLLPDQTVNLLAVLAQAYRTVVDAKP